MSEQQGMGTDLHRASTGYLFSGSAWLDVHFEACRPEYEAMLRSVGLQMGWHVLDAGCGSGGFLPLVAEAVGSTGAITALDLAPENIAAVQEHLSTWGLTCSVATQVGSVLTLPFLDRHVDAVWFANTSQYLSDDDLMSALHEFRRVVRPGGIVAIKEFDTARWTFAPGDPALIWHLYDRTRDTVPSAHGSLRARELRRWLERSGCEMVWQRTTLIERWAPLRPIERQYIADLWTHLAQRAEHADVPKADLAFWHAARDPDAVANPLNHPDFYWCEASVVAVGRVPE